MRGVEGVLCHQTGAEDHYEWKLENLFSLSETEGNYSNSPTIHFSGRTFKLSLYPNTWNGCIVLYLLLKPPSPPVTIRYTLGIKTAAGDTEVWKRDTHEFTTTNPVVIRMRRSELLKRREELALCDALTITASLIVDDSRADIGTTEVAVQSSAEEAGGQEANGGRQALKNTDLETVVQSLKDLYVTGKDCDVTLEVKHQKFRAHKLILGARTPVLAAMFSHNTTEAETGIVRVEDCHPEAFEVFLRFVYSGTAENMTGENVMNVYYVADKYDIAGLKKECLRYMLSNLTTGSVCSVIDLAERHDDELLQKKATEFFVENAREIFRTSSWRTFLAKNSNLANDLIIRGYENSK